ncbi:MAG: transposase, partial [Alcanivoracaceae bacterium]
AQQALFNEAEEIDAEENTAGNDGAVEKITVATHQRKARSRVSLPEHLPREEVIHDLPEAENKDNTGHA